MQKRLHHALYPSHYFPDLGPTEQKMNLMHSQHCLDTLRQGIMCHGDTSLLTLKWAPWTKIPLANFSAPHQCVDWEKLDNWVSFPCLLLFNSTRHYTNETYFVRIGRESHGFKNI